MKDRRIHRLRRLGTGVFFILALLCSVLKLEGAEGGAGMLIPLQKRVDILAKVKYLDRKDPEVEKLIASIRNPFVLGQSAQLKTEDDSSGATRPDREVLEAIVKSLKPEGVLIKGDRKIVLLSGNPVKEGGIIKAPYSGKQYKVIVESISKEACTFKYNKETYTLYFADIRSNDNSVK